jgi:peroxidase
MEPAMNRRTNESQSGKNVRTAANRRGRKACQPSLPGVERLEPRSMMSVNPVSPPPAEPIDGVGNNVAHPTWGSVGQDLLRLSPAAYGDGISSPAGADQPSARLVSNLLSASPEGGVTNDRDMTAFVYVWGQFIDHDMGLTTSASPTERLPISVPTGDPSFDPNGTGTMTISMSRSNWDAATGTSTANVRQQINSITAFIDGSNIYGSDATRAAALREFVGGRLRTSAGNLMPFNTDGLANANDSHLLPDSQLFLAGDVRANENPELVALQTLFVREHNRIAAEAAAKNPGWTDEQLYQHARRLVVAELQKITYDEFLPALLGANTPAAQTLHAYSGYNPAVNPGISTEFSTAAFRLGHSLLNEDIQFLDNDGNPVRDEMRLKDSFFDPRSVQDVGIDPLLKYSASDRTQEIDTKVVDDLRNFLFGQPGQGGFDLAALNIQRGRDHGLADYNTVRVAYGLPRVTSFAQITPDTAVQSALQQAYGTVDKIDLWVGGLAEKHLPNSSVGQTFTAIMVDQFKRLQSGDRSWYQNVLPASAVSTIQKTTLGDIIRRNTQLTNLQPDVFVLHTSIAGTAFVDGNRDGTRQQREGGIANATVSLVTAAGATVATTRTDARGDYVFRGMDLGSFSVVVTPPAVNGQTPPSVTSRTVAITRGMDARLNVALPPKPATPGPKPAGSQPSTLSPSAAVFAGIGAGMPGAPMAPGVRKR